MQKLFWIVPLLLLQSFTFSTEPAVIKKPWSIQERLSAFVPQSTTVRDIYGSVWPAYSLEADYLVWHHYSPFFNLGFMYKSGKSIGWQNSTEVYLLPLIAGVNGLWHPKPWLHPFFGGGMGTAYIHFNDHSHYVRRHPHAWGGSLLLQAGCEMDFSSRLFFDLFTSYRWHFFHFAKHHGVKTYNPQMGGFELGGSFGVRF